MKGIDRVRARIAQIEERYRQIVSKRSGLSRFDAALKRARRSGGPAGPSELVSLAEDVSRRYGLDSALVRAVIGAESGWNAGAVSRAGAQGLMQLMPATARALGVSNPYDPAQNVDAGVRHLRGLLDNYDGDLKRALAAYNAGSAAVDRYGGVPPYPETQRFVERVLAAYAAGEGG